jgi:nitroreductase
MVRAFRPEPVPAAVLERVLDAGRRAPSAGHSQGWAFLVLEGPEQTAAYWDVTFPDLEARAAFSFPGLFDAPVLILPLTHAYAYVARYAEPDKAAAGLGDSADSWPVPYWTVDTSFAAMLMLLAAVDEGLGALFFGIFEGAEELLRSLGVPEGYAPIGTIALGWPDEARDRRGLSSASRGRRDLDDVVHRGRW